MHLLMDGFGGDVKNMKDEEFVYRFLDVFPSEIGMNKISEPHVTTYHGPQEEDWGVSGFVIIAESHISVHTFPKRRYINIDVFSCKEFDAQRALDDLTARFSLDTVRSWTLDRGLEYSDPEVAAKAVADQRSQLVSRS